MAVKIQPLAAALRPVVMTSGLFSSQVRRTRVGCRRVRSAEDQVVWTVQHRRGPQFRVMRVCPMMWSLGVVVVAEVVGRLRA